MYLNQICIRTIDRGSKKGLSIFINQNDTNTGTRYGLLNNSMSLKFQGGCKLFRCHIV